MRNKQLYFPSSTEVEVKNNRVVAIHYRAHSETTSYSEDTFKDLPIAYLHGHFNIVPGLEKALEGKCIGDTFTVEVEPEEGFPRSSEEIVRIPHGSGYLPSDLKLSVGMPVPAQDDFGEPIFYYVMKVDEKFVYLTLEHPFTGHKVTYYVEVLGVRRAKNIEVVLGMPCLKYTGLSKDEKNDFGADLCEIDF